MSAKPFTRVPTNDPVLAQVQQSIGQALQAINESAAIDMQLVDVGLQNTTQPQVVTIKHDLGRPAKGAFVVSANVMIVGQGGQNNVDQKTLRITVQTAQALVGARATVAVL